MLQRRVARDGEEFAVRSTGGNWLLAWHSPITVPPGKAHGANGFCVTADDDLFGDCGHTKKQYIL